VFRDGAEDEDARLDAAEGLCLLEDPSGRQAVRDGLSTGFSPEGRLELEAMVEVED
jgi:hypothetical protein